MGDPLTPFITGVPEETLGIPKQPYFFNRDFADISIITPAAAGSSTITFDDLGYENISITSVTINGDFVESGGATTTSFKLTLTKNNGEVWVLSDSRYIDAAGDGDRVIGVAFPFYEPLYLRKNDNLKLSLDVTGGYNTIDTYNSSVSGVAF